MTTATPTTSPIKPLFRRAVTVCDHYRLIVERTVDDDGAETITGRPDPTGLADRHWYLTVAEEQRLAADVGQALGCRLAVEHVHTDAGSEFTFTREERPVIKHKQNGRANGVSPAVEACALGGEPHAPPAADPPAPTFELLPVGAIDAWSGNPRKHFDETDLAELATSIKAKGVLEPILVRPAICAVERGPFKGAHERYLIVAGERRWRAAKLAGRTEIPAMVQDLDDKAALEIAVIENEQRADVGPLEKAEGYGRLIEEHGQSIEDVATRVGRSVNTIRGLLKLRQLPEKARKAVEAGELPASTAELIARVPDAKSREEAAAAVLKGRESWEAGVCVKQQLSYRQTKALIEDKFMVELKRAPFPLPLADLGGAPPCKECPKRVGNLQQQDPEGYAGVRADVCTDPSCYREKVKAWQARALADAEVKGQKVLGQGECKKLFNYDNRLAYGAAYFDLAEQHPEHPKPANKWRSYKQLLAGHLEEKQIVLAFDDQGVMHRLIGKDVALPILRKEHGLFKESAASRSRTSDEEKAERKKRLDDNRLRTAVQHEMQWHAASTVEAWFAKLPTDEPHINQVLRELIDNKVQAMWGSALEDVCKRRGWKGDRKPEQVAQLERAVGAMTGPQLVGLLVELDAVPDLIAGDSRGYRKLLAIDRKGVEKEVRQRLKDAKVVKGDSATEGKKYDEGLRVSLHSFEGAAARWSKLQKAGATDAEIKSQISKEYSSSGGSTAAGGDVAHKGGGDPAFWHGKFIASGKPTLRGKELVAEVRRVMAIPQPAQLRQAVEAKAKPVAKAANRTTKAQRREVLAASVSRGTLLVDLLTGKDVASYVKIERALDGAGLSTVGDLLDRAAATPKQVPVGDHWEDGTATVYEVLHAINGVGRPAALEIGDALIDAGLAGAAARAKEAKA